MSDADKYVVYLRFPFPRGDFIDPEPVSWDESKTQRLWKILSQTPQSDVDWPQLAETFGVSVSFLLQHAAWFYERRLNQVRSHMRRVSSSGQSPSIYNSRPPSSTSGIYTQSNRVASEDQGSNDAVGGSGASNKRGIPAMVTSRQSAALRVEEGATSSLQKMPTESRIDDTTTNRPEQNQHPTTEVPLGLDEQLAAFSMREGEEGRWQETPSPAVSSHSSSREGSPEVQNPFKLSAPQPPRIEDVASLASTATTSRTNMSPLIPVATKILPGEEDGEDGFVAQDLEGEIHDSDGKQNLPKEATPQGSNKSGSLGSSNFSDLTDTSISRSALEEAVMSDIRHDQGTGKSGQ